MTSHDGQLTLSYDAPPQKGLGNGGVTPPLYERRKEGTFNLEGPSDAIRAQVGHQFRQFWRDDLLAHLGRGEIDPIDYAIGMALAEFSDKAAKVVFPSQATIGKKVGRSPSTVNRRLAKLRRLGLLEWAHRFLQSRDGKPRATTNLYVFRLSDHYMDEDFEKRLASSNKAKGKGRRQWKSGRTTEPLRPEKKARLDEAMSDTVIAFARSAASFDEGLELVLSATDEPDAEFQFRRAWKQIRPLE